MAVMFIPAPRTATSLLLLLLLALSACGDGSEWIRPLRESTIYGLDASAPPGASPELECGLAGQMDLKEVLDEGDTLTGMTDLWFKRGATSGSTEVLETDWLEETTVRAEFVRPESVRVILEGVVSDTLTGAYLGRRTSDAQVFHGSWTCDPHLPFYDDSLLQAAGWNDVERIDGTWTLMQVSGAVE